MSQQPDRSEPSATTTITTNTIMASTSDTAKRMSLDKDQPPLPSDSQRTCADTAAVAVAGGKPSVQRSTSSTLGRGLLKRLASQSSSRSRDDGVDGEHPSIVKGDASFTLATVDRRASQSSSSSASHRRLTKAELAELSRPRGKYKSGVCWDQYGVPEPFMEVTASTTDGEGAAALKQGLVSNAMLSSASTAAARSYVENRGLAEPIFPRAGAGGGGERSASALGLTNITDVPRVDQALAALTQSGVTAGILSLAEAPSPSEHQSSAPMEAVEPFARASPPARSSSDQQMLSEAAQRVLEAARKQARAAQSKKGLSVPASPQTQSPPNLADAADPEAASVTSPAGDETTIIEDSASLQNGDVTSKGSKAGRSKGLLGTIRKGRSRKNSLLGAHSTTSNGSPSTPGSPDTSMHAADSSSGTSGRRRRFNDTRDLDLLAYELAAEALVSGVPESPFARTTRSGTSTPRSFGPSWSGDGRRRSYHSTNSGSELGGFSTSQTSLANLMMQPMTQIHAAQRSREASVFGPSASSNGTPSHSVPGSPAMMPGDVMRPNVRQFSASSPYLNQAASLMPSDMLAGLGGSPYPSLSSKKPRDPLDGIDNLDPFGIPLSHDSPFDATSAYVNRTNVYHTPTQVAHARSQMGSPSGRRSVLTMRMHDPETELQGLTKMPKGKRLIPFGSRASSRVPSPNPSFTNLKEAAASQQAIKAALAKEAQTTPSGPAKPVSRRPLAANVERRELDMRLPLDAQVARPTAFGGQMVGQLEPIDSESQVATPRAETVPIPAPRATTTSSDQTCARSALTAASSDATVALMSRSEVSLSGPAPSAKSETSRPASRASTKTKTLALPTSKSAHRLSGLFRLGKKRSGKDELQLGQSATIPQQGENVRIELAAAAKGAQAPGPASPPTPSTSSRNNDAPSLAPASARIEASSLRPAATVPAAPLPAAETVLLASLDRSERSGNAPAAQPALAEDVLSMAPPPPASSSVVARSDTLSTSISVVGAQQDVSSDLVGSTGRTDSTRVSKSSSRSTRTDDKSASGKGVRAATDRAAPSSTGSGNIRRFLRRLSSFGVSSAGPNESSPTKKNGTKANFPDASTMPKLDRDQLIKAGIIPPTAPVPAPEPTASAPTASETDGSKEVAAPNRIGSLLVSENGVAVVIVEPQHQPTRASDGESSACDAQSGAPSFKTAVVGDARFELVAGDGAEESRDAEGQGLESAHEIETVSSPHDIHPAMARSGFGTKSAFVFSTSPAHEQGQGELGGAASLKPLDRRQSRSQDHASSSMRSDSRTPTSEDSTFLGNGALPRPWNGVGEGEEVITPASSSRSLAAPVSFDAPHLKQPTVPAPAIVDTY